jgi:putative ABC transport system permease protein
MVYLLGLLGQSFVSVARVDLGFTADNLLAVSVPMPPQPPRQSAPEVWRDYQGRVLARTEQFRLGLVSNPTIESVATGTVWPMQTQGEVAFFRPNLEPEIQIEGRAFSVGTGFLRAMDAQLMTGREPSAEETARADYPAIATSSLARELEKLGPVLGQTVALSPGRRHTIVGVVRDMKLERADEGDIPTLFVYLQYMHSGPVILLRTQSKSTPGAAEAAVIAAGRSVWGTRAPQQVFRVSDSVNSAREPYRARAAMIVLMCLCSLPIALAGLLGASADSVARQRREIAVRLALGATSTRIGREILGEFLGAGLLGIMLGVTAGVSAGWLTRSLLFGVSAAHYPSALAVAALMGAAILIAIALPLRSLQSLNIARLLRDI